jgi:hypothetical protein
MNSAGPDVDSAIACLIDMVPAIVARGWTEAADELPPPQRGHGGGNQILVVN